MMRDYKDKPGQFESYEAWVNSFKMSLKMYKTIFLVLTCTIVVFFFVIIKSTYTYETYVTGRYTLAKILNVVSSRITLEFWNEDETMVRVPSGTILESSWINNVVDTESKRLVYILFFIAIFGYFVIFPLIILFIRKKSNEQSASEYIRGARFITPKEYTKKLKENKQIPTIPMASIKMGFGNESRGTFIVGKPGKGKTVCLNDVLENIKDRGGKAIIYDYKGDYVSKFYDSDRDLIFNPLDARSVGWTVMNEVQTYMDVDAIAGSLIPPAISNADPFWPDAARGVVAGCMHYLYREEIKNNAALWDLLTMEAKDLSKKFKGLKGAEAGYRYINVNDETSKQADSVLSVAMQYTKCFEYMGGAEGDFNVDKWLRNENGGCIFITNYEIIQDTLKPILSLFLDLLCRRSLSMEESYNRRIYFLLDEIGTLQRLTSLVKFLTNIRSKGGAPFIGVQDYAQLEKIYSKEIAHTILNAMNNSVIFALSDQSAKRASENIIGKYDYWEMEKSVNMGVTDFRDGISLNKRKKSDFLVLPSEIQNMPDLEAIIKFENYDYVKDQFKHKKRLSKNKSFILKSGLSMDEIVRSEKELAQKRMEFAEKISMQEEYDEYTDVEL